MHTRQKGRVVTKIAIVVAGGGLISAYIKW